MAESRDLLVEIEALGEKIAEARQAVGRRFIGQERVVELSLSALLCGGHGLLVGLPIDIRHVAFSSAFIGIAFVGLDLLPDLWLLAWAVLGVATIGFMNLMVSFMLALNVALRSRQVSDPQWKNLARSVVSHLRRQPRDFFMPPIKTA